MSGGAAGAPIFLFGIQRGGTNQLLNMLRSHPATTWPRGEFHEVFRVPGLRAVRGIGLARTLRMLAAYAPIRLTAGDILDPDRPPPREGLLRGFRGRAVTAGLARSVASNRAGVAAYKAALAERGLIDPDPAPARMLVKVMNHNLAFAEDLARLYPGAALVGLIRDGRAVSEGHVARGADPAAAAEAWGFVARRLAALEALGLRTWRFEDLVQRPAAVMAEIYAHAGLDPAPVRGICLQNKVRRTDATGAVRGIDKSAHFYPLAEIARHMRADANAEALARIAPEARAEIERRCGDMLAHFGYPGPGDAPEGAPRPAPASAAPAPGAPARPAPGTAPAQAARG